MVERIDEGEWEGRREIVRRMYVDEDRKLSAIMRVLAAPPSFNPTVSQYKTRLRHWGFKKDRTGNDSTADPEKAEERKSAPPTQQHVNGESSGSASREPAFGPSTNTHLSTISNTSPSKDITSNRIVDPAASSSDLQTFTHLYDPMLPQPSPSPPQSPSDPLTIIPASSLLLYPPSTTSPSPSIPASTMTTTTTATSNSTSTSAPISTSAATKTSTPTPTNSTTTNTTTATQSQTLTSDPQQTQPQTITILPDTALYPDADMTPINYEAEAEEAARALDRIKANYKSRYDVPHSSSNRARVQKRVGINRARKNASA